MAFSWHQAKIFRCIPTQMKGQICQVSQLRLEQNREEGKIEREETEFWRENLKERIEREVN